MTATPALCITGASGFIGQQVLHHLSALDIPRIRCLFRDPARALIAGQQAEVLQGDMRSASSLEEWLSEGAVVLNLAFDANAEPAYNLAAAVALAGACARANAKRLIHLSTAAVVGTNPDNTIDESSECKPSTPYEAVK